MFGPRFGAARRHLRLLVPREDGRRLFDVVDRTEMAKQLVEPFLHGAEGYLVANTGLEHPALDLDDLHGVDGPRRDLRRRGHEVDVAPLTAQEFGEHASHVVMVVVEDHDALHHSSSPVRIRNAAGAYRLVSAGMAERLDEEKLAQIRAWAEAMLTNERSESRAAARGLLLLADEIERLWEANRTAFANDIGAALAQRLGTD